MASLALVSLLLVLSLSFLPLASYGAAHCQSGPLVTQSGDTLVFADPPPLQFTLDPTYHHNGLGPWFGLANGLTNIVRPGGLPYDAMGRIFANDGSSQPNVPQFIGYWGGLIAVSVLAFILALCTPVCGCCFCCFRLCGHCGGKVREEGKHSSRLAWGFTILLVLLTCGLFIGVVVTFHVDTLVLHSPDRVRSVGKAAIQGTGDYILHTVDEMKLLLCQLNSTQNASIKVLQDVGDDVIQTVDSFNGPIDKLFSDLGQLQKEITKARSQLQDVNSSLSDVVKEGGVVQLQSQLVQLAESLISLQQSCLEAAAGSGSNQMKCNQLNSSISSLNANNLSLGMNLVKAQEVLSNDVQNVDNSLGSINIAGIIYQANATYHGYTKGVTANVFNFISKTKQSLLNSIPASNLDTLDQLEFEVTRERGYLNRTYETLSDFTYIIQPYVIAGYVLVFIPVLMVLGVMILLVSGAVCGTVGTTRKKATGSSSCFSSGAVSLLVGVGFTFFIGYLLMMIYSVLFLAGGVSRKACESISYPNYEFFAREVPNITYNVGDRLASLRLESVLRNCHDNQSLFHALEMDRILNISNITLVVVQPDPVVRQQLEELINQNSLNLPALFPGIIDLPNHLSSLTTFYNKVYTVTSSLDASENDLEMIHNDLVNRLTAVGSVVDNSDSNLTKAQNQAHNMSAMLVTLRTQLTKLKGNLGVFDNSVLILKKSAAATQSNAESLVNDINGANGIQKINMTVLGGYDKLISFGQQLADHYISTIMDEVGRCYPVWAVYTAAYNVLCLQVVNGVNGIWLGMVWCYVCLMALVVTAVLLSHQYRRMSTAGDYMLTLPTTVMAEDQVILLKDVTAEDSDDDNNVTV